jgi:hypothetical protein
LSSIRIILGNGGTLASYPEGGGHWSCLLQYLFGLHALGHDVFWLELLESTGKEALDQHWINIFFHRFRRYGFSGRCAVLLHDRDVSEPSLGQAHAYGMTRQQIKELAHSADLVWNFGYGLRDPLLSLFKRRVLLDLDPGHLQVSALTCNAGFAAYDVFLTVGTKLHDSDCAAPTLGLTWNRYFPFVHLPVWKMAPAPPHDAPFTSVTQWTWEELWLNNKVLSVSKRSAYLPFLDMPTRTRRTFELAANIHPEDSTGDREFLLAHGWKLSHPHAVARTPLAYRSYVKRSRAEFQCPKPIHIELKTGWLSDRSVCYLATGRPVLAQDTGFSEKLPTGRGLLRFSNMEEAVAGVEEIDGNYPLHMRAARDLAEEYFSSAKWLPMMLDACGA